MSRSRSLKQRHSEQSEPGEHLSTEGRYEPHRAEAGGSYRSSRDSMGHVKAPYS